MTTAIQRHDWDARIAQRTQTLGGGEMTAILALVGATDVITFSGGFPDPATFPKGVLAEIAGVLGKHQISIASVIQHEPSGDGAGRVVPLVIMTQQAKEGAAQAAVAEIDRLKCARPISVRMRVLD